MLTENGQVFLTANAPAVTPYSPDPTLAKCSSR